MLVAKFSGPVAECPFLPSGAALFTGHPEYGHATPVGGRLSRPANIGRRRRNAAGGKSGNLLLTGSYSVKKNPRRRPFHRAKNRLQSNLTAGYNPRTS